MRNFSHHTTLVIALALIIPCLLTEASTAAPKGSGDLKRLCAQRGGMFTIENSGAYSCMLTDEGMSRNCSASGNCAWVDTRRPEGTPSGGPRGDGKGMDDGKGRVVATDPNSGWNGQYTTVVTQDGRGMQTYTVKQGVPIENGQMILAPNGTSYHVWDPELARQLKAAGVNAAYANPASAKNEYAVARDKVVRDRAIAVGQPVPQPTGHRNNDALGNAAPVVDDHRHGPAVGATPAGPPPAAPAGTASTNVSPSGGAEPAVRDHRKASGGGGGVTVTQTQKAAGGSGSARSTNGGNDRKSH